MLTKSTNVDFSSDKPRPQDEEIDSNPNLCDFEVSYQNEETISLTSEVESPIPIDENVNWYVYSFGCFMVFLGIILTIIGSMYFALVYQSPVVCGTSYDSAYFSMSLSNDGTTRYLVGNSCPGYDWTGQTAPYHAGAFTFNYSVPVYPVNCSNPQIVGLTSPVMGTIGITADGLRLFGPVAEGDKDAVKAEGQSFDSCGGHVSEEFMTISQFIVGVNAETTVGYYHRHVTPGAMDSKANVDSLNLNYSFCSAVASWVNESTTSHSPILGFMADGIPIYGPYGADGEVPENLDNCNGHASDKSFYHYHFTSDYPYTVNCLWGYTDGSWETSLNRSSDCDESTTQYDYSSLQDLTWSYGGSGYNSKYSNGTYVNYPSSIAFLLCGVLTFLASTGCMFYFYWWGWIRERWLGDPRRDDGKITSHNIGFTPSQRRYYQEI